jgi:hypothetical protein
LRDAPVTRAVFPASGVLLKVVVSDRMMTAA